MENDRLEFTIRVMTQEQKDKIRELNDDFRQNLTRAVLNQRLFFSDGFNALDHGTQSIAIMLIEDFTDFNRENDPYGEHDFMSFEVNGKQIFAKIDYYDNSLQYMSEEPWNPEVTKRVMTVMLAEEY